jgi:hypothetical protein
MLVGVGYISPLIVAEWLLGNRVAAPAWRFYIGLTP